MSRRALLPLACLALAGVWCAQVLAGGRKEQVPTVSVSTPVTTATVTVPVSTQLPTTSVPTTAPPPPSVSTPVPTTSPTAAAPTLPTTRARTPTVTSASRPRSVPTTRPAGTRASTDPARTQPAGSPSPAQGGATGGTQGARAQTTASAGPQQSAGAALSPAGTRLTLLDLRAAPARSRGGETRGRPVTTLSFSLPAPRRVRFLVRGRNCRAVGRFTVRGRKGVNRVRFSGRIGKRTLPQGTYTIVPDVRGSRASRRAIAVFVGPRGGARLLRGRKARAASTACTSAVGASGTASAAAEGTSGVAGEQQSSGAVAGVQRIERVTPTGERTARATRFSGPPWVSVPYLSSSSPWLHTAVLTAVLLATLLLLVAAVPPSALAESRVTEALARWRAHVAAVGASSLLAAAVIFLLVGF